MWERRGAKDERPKLGQVMRIRLNEEGKLLSFQMSECTVAILKCLSYRSYFLEQEVRSKKGFGGKTKAKAILLNILILIQLTVGVENLKFLSCVGTRKERSECYNCRFGKKLSPAATKPKKRITEKDFCNAQKILLIILSCLRLSGLMV